MVESCSGYYNEIGLAQSRLWEPGTMCITIAANIAETGFLTFPACIPDSVVAFTPTIEGKTPQFLRMFIELTRTSIEQFAPATAQKNINLGIINQLLLPVPPLAEQAAIVERVEALMAICRKLETEIEHSRTHAADLLQAVLKEAFATQSSAPEYKPYQPAFARQLLAVEILYRHNEDDMNQMKLQKLIHLCEHHAQIPDVQGQYQRAAAGPYDNHLMHPLAATLRKQNWFRRNGRYQDATYTALEKAGSHQKYLGKWEKCLPKINELLTLVGPLSPERCEIISTLYAAWNDLIIDGKMPTDTEILTEVSADRWHEKKGRIDTPRWKKALKWMRDQNLIPTGFGKRTVLPSKK